MCLVWHFSCLGCGWCCQFCTHPTALPAVLLAHRLFESLDSLLKPPPGSEPQQAQQAQHAAQQQQAGGAGGAAAAEEPQEHDGLELEMEEDQEGSEGEGGSDAGAQEGAHGCSQLLFLCGMQQVLDPPLRHPPLA